MKRIIMLALALSLFMGASVAKAGPVDMTTVTCDEITNDHEGFMTCSLWIMGYLAGKTDDTHFGGERLDKFGDQLWAMCVERPEATLGEVVNYLLQ